MMLQTMLIMLALTSPFSVQPTAEPAAMWQGNQSVELAVKKSAPTQILPIEQQNEFKTVNDISLQDTKSEVLSKKGYPEQTKEDLILGSREYIYDDVTIGIIDGTVSYIQVKKDATYLKVNDVYMELTPRSIKHTLGEPDFIAEDGDVYIKGHQAVKVYLDENQHLKQVEFFDEASF
ncbi:hypothetical protein J45TS6_36730 [Paenibacillus sp. J45TS6]|uniref:hypothetical protein n=1 Tax=Paenibacillus sp. J45TS6 TaxID=2807196 RepID=UPI001B206A6E|nr:hypothetical protein [Paenibacillus sp. J45TS6]GIP45214.1 hypothetical protein J45TS6_36730 [Paenibacillus sp. J45TS6]